MAEHPRLFLCAEECYCLLALRQGHRKGGRPSATFEHDPERMDRASLAGTYAMLVVWYHRLAAATVGQVHHIRTPFLGLSLTSDYGDRAMSVPDNSMRDTAHQSPP